MAILRPFFQPTSTPEPVIARSKQQRSAQLNNTGIRSQQPQIAPYQPIQSPNLNQPEFYDPVSPSKKVTDNQFEQPAQSGNFINEQLAATNQRLRPKTLNPGDRVRSPYEQLVQPDLQSLFDQISNTKQYGEELLATEEEAKGRRDLKRLQEIQALKSSYSMPGYQGDSLQAGSWYFPVGKTRVTANFGQSGSRWRSSHTGIDYGVPTGTAVRSAYGGKVISVGSSGPYGNNIVVDHGGGVVTRYAHLSKLGVKPGQRINAGALIGKSGATGNVTGPHLHFEVKVNGKLVDPAKFMEGRQSYNSGSSGANSGGLSSSEKWIIGKESSGRTNAKNPRSSAFGLGQLILANRKKYAAKLGVSPNTTDYEAQKAMFRMYVKERYGTADNARAFWQKHGWY